MGMEGTDQKTVASSAGSSKHSKMFVDSVAKASQSRSKSVKQSADNGLILFHSDPTRFGDWERAGRCIDF